MHIWFRPVMAILTGHHGPEAGFSIFIGVKIQLEQVATPSKLFTAATTEISTNNSSLAILAPTHARAGA